jgi:hypothetical protein
MNKGRLLGGLVCLAAAVLLLVLVYTLPEGKVLFVMDGSNRPMIPVLGLAVLGLAQLATSGRR